MFALHKQCRIWNTTRHLTRCFICSQT